MDKLNFENKKNGDPLDASEWNSVVNKVDELVDANNNSEGGSSIEPIDISGLVSINSKGNVTVGNNNVKNVNIEPGAPYSKDQTKYGDIALKPGDDIQFASHHREPKKRDKIVIKNIDSVDNPIKLQTVAAEIELAVGTQKNPKTATKKKDKSSGEDTSESMFKPSDAKTLDVKILTGNVLEEGTDNERDERGYLKIRAQAIDLRCEKHGGIALQPKGYDDDGNMNKIKFEHGGGDGLEFGTFNPEKSSLYTDEYRFKKDGIWKMAIRETTPNTKQVYDDNTPSGKESTATNKYVKQSDDFYDIIDSNDETATTKSIIKTAHALNDGKNRHAKYEEKVTTKGELKKTLEIQTNSSITFTEVSEGTPKLTLDIDPTKEFTISDFKDLVKLVETSESGVYNKYGKAGESGVTLSDGDIISINGINYKIVQNFSPSIDINSEEDLSIKAKEGTLNIGGNVVEFGSDIIDLGEMEDGLYAQYKLTKKNNSKACDVVKVKVINNQTSPLTFDSDSSNFYVESFYPGLDAEHPAQVSVPGKVENPSTEEEANQNIKVVAQCKLIDMIKLVSWAKANNFGPWAN